MKRPTRHSTSYHDRSPAPVDIRNRAAEIRAHWSTSERARRHELALQGAALWGNVLSQSETRDLALSDLGCLRPSAPSRAGTRGARAPWPRHR